MADEVPNSHATIQSESVPRHFSFMDEIEGGLATTMNGTLHPLPSNSDTGSTNPIGNGTSPIGNGSIGPIANGNTSPSTSRQPMDQMNRDFQPEIVPSNRDDRKRKPKEFAARHVQMMALGIAPQRRN